MATTFSERLKAKKDAAALMNKGPSAEDLVRDRLQKQVDEWLNIFKSADLGNIDSVKRCIDSGAKTDAFCPLTENTALILAAKNGFPKIVQLMLQKGANVNLRGYGGLTALHHACKNTQYDIVEILVSETNIDTELEDDAGNTAIALAARMGHLSCLDRMAVRGANIEHANHQKTTPFIIATINNHPAIIDSLVKLDCDVNARDVIGNTALHYASMCGHSAMIKQLLSHSCRVGILNGDEKDAIEVAANQKCKDQLMATRE
jgi:ankyrin repeat protein